MSVWEAIDEGFKKTFQTMMMYPVDPASLQEADLDAVEAQGESTKAYHEEDPKAADLSMSYAGETLSASFYSETPTLDDGSFATADALSVRGVAEESAWYYLPDKLQEKLEKLTAGQRQRVCRLMTAAVIVFLVANASLLFVSRRGSASSSASTHDDQMTPDSNGTVSEISPTSTLPLPTEAPTIEPTRGYSDMATGPTMNIDEYLGSLLGQSSQPPSKAPTTEAPTNLQNTGTYEMTTPPQDAWQERNVTAPPTISLSPSVSPTQRHEPVITVIITPGAPSPPTVESTMPPTLLPTTGHNSTYIPGLLNHMQHGLRLSNGLQARLIATSGQPVQYINGQTSSVPFHYRPDAGATFQDTREDSDNFGGWVYVSNSEMRLEDAPGGIGNGGVGAITFDKDGQIIKYEMLLTNTTWNCGGGKDSVTMTQCRELVCIITLLHLNLAQAKHLGTHGLVVKSLIQQVKSIKCHRLARGNQKS
jgi:hypothetical protein